MIYQYTGQPGHGKTLQAINRALEFKKQGRTVYVCNVRGFDYEKTGMEKMEPADFIDWMNFLPDGAVCLVDECYEKGMLTKRSASQKLPEHVERLGTHRHRGIDFIFVCQSPDKQMDTFVHDLIEEHVHVRRKFGTHFQNLRTFDRFERNPEKSIPLVTKRVRFPKHVFGLYKSTELDTTEKKIPWYMWAFGVGLPVGLGFILWTFSSMDDRLTARAREADALKQSVPTAAGHDAVAAGTAAAPKTITGIDFIERFAPRVASQPWSAPAYDELAVPAKAPRVFCMSSEPSIDEYEPASCSCLTEQGTRYAMKRALCHGIARNGQYEPFFDEAGQVSDGQSYAQDSRRQLDIVQHEKTVIGQPGEISDVFPRNPSYEPGESGIRDNKAGPNG